MQAPAYSAPTWVKSWRNIAKVWWCNLDEYNERFKQKCVNVNLEPKKKIFLPKTESTYQFSGLHLTSLLSVRFEKMTMIYFIFTIGVNPLSCLLLKGSL